MMAVNCVDSLLWKEVLDLWSWEYLCLVDWLDDEGWVLMGFALVIYEWVMALVLAFD